jgi:hypothetical protein
MSKGRLLARIRREFQDHPGIAVTLPQAQVLWSLDKRLCTEVFDDLTAEGFLRQVDNVYLWADAPVPQFRRPVAMRAPSSDR